MIQADSVHSTPPKTVSKIDRTSIMARAWSIFRTTYKYPSIKFARIGRKCFASCLRQAWAEAKNAAVVAAIPTPVKVARTVALHIAIQRAPLGESWAQACHEIGAARTELARLSA